MANRRQTKEYSPVSFSHRHWQPRTKYDWAGVGISAAFKQNLDFYLRSAAQRTFYQAVKNAQKKVAQICGCGDTADCKAKVKPQIGPCYTTYPSSLAAYAAIGLSAFMEFKTRVSQKILSTHLKSYLENPAEKDEVRADPAIYKIVAQTFTRWIEARLIMEDLSRNTALSSIEIYRLFSASQENLKFNSLSEMIRIVILYGDVLPDWQKMEIYPLSREVLLALTKTSNPFFSMITKAKQSELTDIGIKWVRALCNALAVYLPPRKDVKQENDESGTTKKEDPSMLWLERCMADQFGTVNDYHFAPLDGPAPPLLLDPTDAYQQTVKALNLNSAGTQDQISGKSIFSEILNNFSQAVNQAGGQANTWQDMRSDILENTLRNSAFALSPIEGSPTDGHRVKAYGELEAYGEIYDRVEELSDDHAEFNRLLAEADPITAALKKNLYPNIEEHSVTQNYCTSGSLDPKRLALGDVSSAIFKRYRIEQRADQRGRPVLVIACDGSGSLNTNQMKMVKTLTTAYLNSTAKNSIQILAGLYHSDTIRRGISGPLVRWLYHPMKTPVSSPKEAVHCVANLPGYGTGAQSDALSLAFIMDEAKRLAKGNMIYLVLITDTSWNLSFQTGNTAKEEMQSFFYGVYDELLNKLHVTMVALGVSEKTGFEDIVDALISISKEELENSIVVAEKIGMHVATCIRHRSFLQARR